MTADRTADANGNWEPPWTPKMWSGMTLSTWLQLLARNQWSVDRRRTPMALAITAYAGYQTNQHDMPAELRQAVDTRLQAFRVEYGYATGRGTVCGPTTPGERRPLVGR